MATRLDLKTTVLAHQFSSANYSALIDKWLNEGVKKVYRRSNMRVGQTTSTINTVAGTNSYSLPSDFNSFISLRNTSITPNEELDELSASDFDANTDSSVGTPYLFSVYGSTLYIYPTPQSAGTLVLRYWKLPTDMTTDNDEVPLPDDYENVIVEYALKKCYAAEGDIEMSNFHNQNFETELVQLAGELQTDMNSPPEQVPGAFLFDDT